MAVREYPSSIVLVLFASLVWSCYAYQFNVGGRDGWVTNPSENYNHWAERMRFQVNDTLFFKYDKGSDSVLVVNKDDYDKCQIDKPILKLDDGKSIFKCDRSGPFYFISGNKQHCENGEKIIIVVLAVRNKKHTPSVPSPTKGPAPAPAVKSPTGSPAPAAQPPATTPATRGPVPSSTKPPSPVPSHKAPSPSPLSPTSLPPSSFGPGSPTSSPAGSSAPTSGNTPGDIRSPARSPRRSSAVSVFTPTVMLVSTVSLVISTALGGFVHSY